MFDILQYLPPGTKRTPSGWYSFNCPACVHNGETPDKRKRGGLIVDGPNWSYNCFNCNFKTRFVMGQLMSYKTRKLLEWLGVDQKTIQRINLDSLKNKKLYDLAARRSKEQQEIELQNIFFKKHQLPSTARSIMSGDKWAINYLKNVRGLDYRDYPFKITPQEKGRNKNRIIIPFIYAGDVVGWTSRFLDDRQPKYLTEHQQPGFVFGLNMQKPDWDFLLVTEGPFDAISIRGTALMHNEINDRQMALLRRQGKEIIVVPDQDKPGLELAEQALEAGFSISVPDWDVGIKDVSSAVKHYGRIPTLISIMSNKTSSKIRAAVMIKRLIRKKIDD